MNIAQALAEVGKHQPCPHDCIDAAASRLPWVVCDDCYGTVSISSLRSARAESDNFLKALGVIHDHLKQE